MCADVDALERQPAERLEGVLHNSGGQRGVETVHVADVLWLHLDIVIHGEVKSLK